MSGYVYYNLRINGNPKNINYSARFLIKVLQEADGASEGLGFRAAEDPPSVSVGSVF